MLQTWLVISLASLAFSLPVLALSYYNVVLFFSALRYPRSLGLGDDAAPEPGDYHPEVSILVATFNEKHVIARTLDTLGRLDYPREKLRLVVADDSTDETAEIIDRKVRELNLAGVDAVISRRRSREHFKAGALNRAARLLKGEYVLLLDADSTVPPDALTRGLCELRRESASFVSYRVGHYNREKNLVTRLFALSLDMSDTLTKMGSYSFAAPFSYQGGFTLISRGTLERVGFWSNDTITEDAEVSAKLYCLGERGVYLSNTRIFSEDPATLEVWKRQTARVAQGWAKCVAKLWRSVLATRELSPPKKLALFFIFLSPYSSLSWIIVNFLAALAVVLGASAPADSIFSNPLYVAAVSIPTAFFFASAGYALYVQKLLTARNAVLIPLLSYVGACMLTASSVGLVNGIRGKTGFFFRTPKVGLAGKDHGGSGYFRALRLERVALVEAVLSVAALALAVLVAMDGVWVLALSLLGFGALTILSMDLQSKVLNRAGENRRRGIDDDEESDPSVARKVLGAEPAQSA